MPGPRARRAGLDGRGSPRWGGALIVLVVAIAGCAGPPGPSPSMVLPGPLPTRAVVPSDTGRTTAATPLQEEAPMSSQPDVPSPATTFRLTSSAFEDGSPIPVEHTCEGENVSPPLRWSGVPEGTKALVLYVDDPDGRDWIHWMVYDMPPTQRSLPYALSPFAEPPRQGRNDFGGQGYAGPCPPSRTHRYFFRLYALAEPLALPRLANGGLVRQGLSRATVLGTAVLMGTFTKGAGGYITGPS